MFIDSVPQIIIFLIHVTNVTYFSKSESKKQNILKMKNGTLYVRKANIMLITSSKQEKRILF